MTIIDGKELAKQIKTNLAATVAEVTGEGARAPHLAVILVGDDKSSATYVRGKAKASAEVGIENTTIHRPADLSHTELLDLVEKLNNDPAVDGILVQLPLPEHIDTQKIIEHIDPSKDVDGLTSANAGCLAQALPGVRACTPRGIIAMLDSAGVRIDGARAVVVGRSNLVGFPVAKMLLDRDATVTIAHTHTRDLGAVTREADILVVAAGSPRLIKADMVKEGAAVIDVGISWDDAAGRLVGDVDFDAVKDKTSAISPVPGGVGPMTIAGLMMNTVECWLRHIRSEEK